MDNVVRSYSDFQGLASLKFKAHNDQTSAVKEVGEQFEAFFIHEMLKSMREATNAMKSGLWDSSATDTYNQMFDQELASSMAKGQGLGVTEWLVAQLDAPEGAKNLRKNTGIEMYLQGSPLNVRDQSKW